MKIKLSCAENISHHSHLQSQTLANLILHIFKLHKLLINLLNLL